MNSITDSNKDKNLGRSIKIGFYLVFFALKIERKKIVKYKQMLNNIVIVINYICISNNYLIDIYRDKEDIKIDIVDKNEEKLIYTKDFNNASDLYYSLLEDLINIFGNSEVMLSRIFQENHMVYQQGIYINNLEFRFDINSKNPLEVNKAFERHTKINYNIQQHKTKIIQKTNHSELNPKSWTVY